MAYYWYFAMGGSALLAVALMLRAISPSRQAIPLWLASGLAGLLVGAGGALAAMHTIGYQWERQKRPDSQAPVAGVAARANGAAGASAGPGAAGGIGGGGGMAGRGGSGAAGGGPSGAGGAPPADRAKRELAATVAKLDALTRGIHLESDQPAKLGAKLAELDQQQEMTNDEAESQLDELRDLLTSEQKEMLGSIDIPRPRTQGGGAAGGRTPLMGPSSSSMTGYPGMESASPKAAPANPSPFRDEENQKHLHALLDRLQAQPAGEDAGR
jgi:hypothetical protein